MLQVWLPMVMMSAPASRMLSAWLGVMPTTAAFSPLTTAKSA